MTKLILKTKVYLKKVVKNISAYKKENKTFEKIEKNKSRIIILSQVNIGVLIAKSIRAYNSSSEIIVINPINQNIFDDYISIDSTFEDEERLSSKYNFKILKDFYIKINHKKKLFSTKLKNYQYSFLIIAKSNNNSFSKRLLLENEDENLYILEDVDSYPFLKNSKYTEKFLDLIIGLPISKKLN